MIGPRHENRKRFAPASLKIPPPLNHRCNKVLRRVRERCADLLGPNGWRWRIIRTSNAYKFNDPASESENRTGTVIPDSNSSLERPKTPKKTLCEGLAASFEHLWTGIQRKAEAKPA
jgi:hypothetical protein